MVRRPVKCAVVLPTSTGVPLVADIPNSAQIVGNGADISPKIRPIPVLHKRIVVYLAIGEIRQTFLHVLLAKYNQCDTIYIGRCRIGNYQNAVP